MVGSENRALPQVNDTLVPSTLTSTGLAGNARVMSDSSRPGHQNASGRSDFGSNLHLGRHFVVESRDRQPLVGAGQQHAGQHGHRRPGRQISGNPRDRIGEVFAYQAEFQIGETNVVVATSIASLRSPPQQALTSGFPVSHARAARMR